MEFPVIYGVNNEIDTSQDVTGNDLFSTLSTFSSFVTRCKHDVLYYPFTLQNFASRAVQEALGSCLTNKYSEGYPGARWVSSRGGTRYRYFEKHQYFVSRYAFLYRYCNISMTRYTNDLTKRIINKSTKLCLVNIKVLFTCKFGYKQLLIIKSNWTAQVDIQTS